MEVKREFRDRDDLPLSHDELGEYYFREYVHEAACTEAPKLKPEWIPLLCSYRQGALQAGSCYGDSALLVDAHVFQLEYNDKNKAQTCPGWHLLVPSAVERCALALAPYPSPCLAWQDAIDFYNSANLPPDPYPLPKLVPETTPVQIEVLIAGLRGLADTARKPWVKVSLSSSFAFGGCCQTNKVEGQGTDFNLLERLAFSAKLPVHPDFCPALRIEVWDSGLAFTGPRLVGVTHEPLRPHLEKGGAIQLCPSNLAQGIRHWIQSKEGERVPQAPH